MGLLLEVRAIDYDAELRMHTEVLRRAYGIGPHDHVLDIGCGAGETTRDAARLAVAGSVVGVDVSAPMIERARRSAEAAGLHNVTFEQADAEFHHFPVERWSPRTRVETESGSTPARGSSSRAVADEDVPSITGNGPRVNHADQSIRDRRERRRGEALSI